MLLQLLQLVACVFDTPWLSMSSALSCMSTSCYELLHGMIFWHDTSVLKFACPISAAAQFVACAFHPGLLFACALLASIAHASVTSMLTLATSPSHGLSCINCHVAQVEPPRNIATVRLPCQGVSCICALQSCSTTVPASASGLDAVQEHGDSNAVGV